MAPEAIDGDKFQISVIGGGFGSARVVKGEIVWENDNSAVVPFSDIDKVNGSVCAYWNTDLFVSAKFDANCCFAFSIDNVQTI